MTMSLRGFLVVNVMTLLMTSTVPRTSAQNVINIITPEGSSLPSTMVTTPRVGGTAVTEAAVTLIEQSCIFEEDNMLFRRLAYLETRDGTSGRTYGQTGFYGGIWRVKEAMFRMTQANTPQLQTKYAQIRDVFGINWMNTTWQDLEKPLYSALAAALYIFLQGPIPFSLESQGDYIHSHYDNDNSAFNYTMSSHDVPVCARSAQVDLVFLLDATTSQDDFTRMRSFMRQVVDSPLQNSLRVSVYQFGGQGTDGRPTLQRNVFPGIYSSQQQLQNLIGGLAQARVPSTALDIGQAVISVVYDAFSTSQARPLSTRIVIVLTDKASSNDFNMQTAAHTAQNQGVTLMAVGLGGQALSRQLSDLVTSPVCRHRLMLPSSRELRDIVQRLQRTICNEPMIATGMVRCAIEDCRNIAFPLVSNVTTLIANVSCDDGRVVIATRTPRPGQGFEDFGALVDGGNDGATPTYVTIRDDKSPFLYADFLKVGYTAPGCVATLSTANGIIGQPKQPTCKDYKYPSVNPCQTPGRTATRFPYDADHGMFIQCDLQDKMYLTHCPPGEPFYSPECEMCVGGPQSPAVSECHQGTQNGHHDTPYCGLDSNPCTRDNILQGHFYFACPINESYYLQCNIWGHAFVRSCPEHEVWRQQSLTCEYSNTAYNPCGTPGVRFYPYPLNPHYYIDCGTDMVPNIMPCHLELVWNPHLDTCDYPHLTTFGSYFTHLTDMVTLPSTYNPSNNNNHGGQTPNPQTGLVSQGFVAPCTQEHISAMQLYWPYEGHPHQYIQCDLWGDAFVRTCQPGFFFDKFSSTCVDGDVFVDNQLQGGSIIG